MAAFRWLATDAVNLGIDPARIVVAGDSAGATIATVLARLVGDDARPPCLQWLFYPITDLGLDSPSYRSCGEGFMLTRTGVEWARGHYLNSLDDVADPRASPLRADDIAGIAPALVYTAGFDPLRDEGKAYADKLARAGVKTIHREFDSLIHGFVGMRGVLQAGARAMDEMVAGLRHELGQLGRCRRRSAAMPDETATLPRRGERSGRREQNKAENRIALLKAARAVFAEMGAGAASVRDIVRRTDLASGTFYNYFKDKDEIFEAVVGELTGDLLKRHRQGRGQARTAEEFLRRHYAVYFDFLVEDPELLAMARKNFTAIRTLLDKPDVRALAMALNEDIRAAIARGILPNVDVSYLAASLAGVAFEVSVVMVARDPVDPAGATEFATKLMLGGLDALPRRTPT